MKKCLGILMALFFLLAALSNAHARSAAVSWTDVHGNFWLFGGQGYDSNGNFGYLNDLWEFNGTNWTLVSGSSTANQAGSYGTQGVAAAGNVPGARSGAVSWTDVHGNLWLFGGQGYDSKGNIGYLNDLWEFNGTNWAWAAGSVRAIRQAATVRRASRRREMSRGALGDRFMDRHPGRPLALRGTGLRFRRQPGRPQRPLGIQRDELGLGLRQQCGRSGREGRRRFSDRRPARRHQHGRLRANNGEDYRPA